MLHMLNAAVCIGRNLGQFLWRKCSFVCFFFFFEYFICKHWSRIWQYLIFRSLAVVARKRPVHYNSFLSVLLDFHPNLESVKGCHAASVQYSIRTALLGFLRCTSSPMIEVGDSYFIVLFLYEVCLLLLNSSLLFFIWIIETLSNIDFKYLYANTFWVGFLLSNLIVVYWNPVRNLFEFAFHWSVQ